jgi:hypothetical protein
MRRVPARPSPSARLPVRLLVAGVAAVALAAFAAACGGGSDETTSATRPPPSADVRPPRLPRADRLAFGRIRSASGALRAAAVPVAYGASPRVDASQLRRVLRRLSGADPQNAQLQKLKARTLDALNTLMATGQGAPAKAVANEAIAVADRIDDGLRGYAASHPAANEIQPR